MTIALVDTSVFCNILPVPGLAERRPDVVRELRQALRDNFTLLLPVATILETGRHIACLGDGTLRRQTAQRFVDTVGQALDRHVPWTIPQPLLDPDALRGYLDEFPDSAMRGLSLADLSIIKEFERQCQLHAAHRVFIWSLDTHLQSYDRRPA